MRRGGVGEGWDQGSTENVGISGGRLRGRRRVEQSAADREERLSDTPLFARGREVRPNVDTSVAACSFAQVGWVLPV